MSKLAFSAHRVDRDQIRPLNDVVIVGEMTFTERFTNTGIMLLNDNGKTAGIRPRWGQVYAVGPDQKDVQVGEWVCIAHGRWTRGIDIEDETGKHTLRRVDPKDILMSADEQPDDLTFSDAVQAEAAPRHMQHS
jgi:co-chaperonin GroES (HSP10)